MKVYKLTDANHQTYGGTQWGPNIEHQTSGKGSLCGPGWLHWYSDPLLAVFLDPVHANFGRTSVLWEAEASGKIISDHDLKHGSTVLRTVRIIDKPVITDTQRIAFGILCVLEVYREKKFVIWANNWLNDVDRSVETAETVYRRLFQRKIALDTGEMVLGWSLDGRRGAARAASMMVWWVGLRERGSGEMAVAVAVERIVKSKGIVDLKSLAKQAMEY